MSTAISQQEQELRAQIAEAIEKIARLEGRLRTLDEELASHLRQQASYQSLDEICLPLEKLGKMGVADLFRATTGHDPEQQLQQIRAAITGFQQKTAAIEQSRNALRTELRDRQINLRHLNELLAELHEEAERLLAEQQAQGQKWDYRLPDMPYRVLPWAMQGEDEQRFRHLLVAVVLLVVAFGGIVPFFRQPVEESKGIVVPERIARIIKKKQEAKQEERKQLEQAAAKKVQDSEKAAEKEADKPVEKIAEKPAEKAPEAVSEVSPDRIVGGTSSGGTSKPVDASVQSIRRSAESKGVLAFKNDFAELLKDTVAPKMGADAQISVSAQRTTGDALQRSIAVSQETGGSGGIDTTAISRQSEGTGSQRIAVAEVKVARVESPAAAAGSSAPAASSAATGGAGRAKGGSGARTDEEIQLVFDQYKSALYRIYNRELRSNPSLRGKIVLSIVIEPDGRVSECVVKSSDLASSSLSAAIVDRVLKFNFGSKEGATAITILYPIEFLPPN